MSKWLKVQEVKYNDWLWINLDNVSVIHIDAHMVLVNGTHGENTGWYTLKEQSFDELIKNVEEF